MELLPLFLTIVLASCIFQGMLGFGFALIAVPVSLTFLPSSFIVPAMTLISLPLNFYLIASIKQTLDRKLIIHLILAGILGMPFGLLILNYFSLWEIKLFAAAMCLLTVLILKLRNLKVHRIPFIDEVFGFLAGVLTTSVSINGAPIAALFLLKGFEKDAFRRTIAVYFVLMALVSLFFLYPKLLPIRNNYLYLYLIVFSVLGGFIGNKLSKYVPEKIHSQLAIIIIFAASIYSLIF